jgi:hypothetical protein
VPEKMLTRWSKIAAFATIKEIQGAADAFQRAIWEYPSAEMLQECIDFFSAKTQLIMEILKIDTETKETEKASDQELQDFIEKWTVFGPEALVKLEELYTAYLDHHGFDRNDAASGEILSRHRFIRLILETYSQFVSQKVARIDGKPARCLSGLKLRSLEELVETGTA